MTSNMNHKEFELAQRVMDGLISSHREKNQEIVETIDPEKLSNFIDNSLREQGYEFSYEEISNVLKDLSGASIPTVVKSVAPPQDDSHLHDVLGHSYKFHYSIKERLEFFNNHRVMSTSEVKEKIDQQLKRFSRSAIGFGITPFVLFSFFVCVKSWMTIPPNLLVLLAIISFVPPIVLMSINLNALIKFYKIKKIKNTALLKTLFLMESAKIGIFNGFNFNKKSLRLLGKKYQKNQYIDLNNPNVSTLAQAYEHVPELKEVWEKWLSYGHPITEWEFLILYNAVAKRIIKKL